MNTGTPSIFSALFSGLVSGLVVALLNYFLTRRKTEAEIQKLEAETEKIRIEIGNNVESLSASVSYKLSNADERIIYDISRGSSGYDFSGDASRSYIDGKAIEPRGEGSFTVKDGVLSIHRKNKEGRYLVWLEKDIGKDEFIAGQRRLRISCQAKAVGSEHTLKFVLKEKTTDKILASEKVHISGDSWNPLEVYFRVSPTADFRFRIDDEYVTNAPSSIHIRGLVLAERKPFAGE